MNEKKSFVVNLIGIPDHERSILRNIFKLSLYRACTYTLALNGDVGQIMLVDADDPEALAAWQSLTVSGKVRSLPPYPPESPSHQALTIMIAREQPTEPVPHWIRRPFVATRVLGVLDQAAALPVEPVHSPVSDAESSIIIQPPSLIVSAPKALVVDDSITVRKQVELELKQFGIQVDTAESGEQAFELISLKSYDVIFLDVILPGIDGYHICKAIKKEKTTKKTPVVMLTSRSSPFDRVKGALSGCDTYLTKPVKQSAFHGVIKKYLKSA